MLYILQTALELGFLYALIPMALFLSFRILNIADMTTDGCFVLGTAVSVTMAAAGHPFLGIPAAMLAGVCAGFVTAFLQTRLGVPSILAGIVTNMGLYTINLMVMGWSANVSLLRDDTIFSLFEETGIGGAWHEALLAGMVTVLAGILLVLFLGTRLGLSIRATGDNIDMVRASSINPTFTITVGLCVANSLTALSGAMVGQRRHWNRGHRPGLPDHRRDGAWTALRNQGSHRRRHRFCHLPLYLRDCAVHENYAGAGTAPGDCRDRGSGHRVSDD